MPVPLCSDPLKVLQEGQLVPRQGWLGWWALCTIVLVGVMQQFAFISCRTCLNKNIDHRDENVYHGRDCFKNSIRRQHLHTKKMFNIQNLTQKQTKSTNMLLFP